MERLQSEKGFGALGATLAMSAFITTAALIALISEQLTQRAFTRATHSTFAEQANKNAVVVTKKLADATVWTQDSTTGVWSTTFADNVLWATNRTSTPKGSVFIRSCDPKQVALGANPSCSGSQVLTTEIGFGNVTSGKLNVTAKTTYASASANPVVSTLSAVIPVAPAVPAMCGTWTPTATTGAPSGRDSHRAIWTGSKMIVWGGRFNLAQGALNTGGLYDPVANSWSTTNLTGAPLARQMFTAVWTGSKMIAWGGAGTGGSPNLNSGGLYDPVANSWTATTTTGAPAARYNHTAVWTGSKMIVWGGTGGTKGGLYDPVANTWTAMTTTGEPPARDHFTGVWTGSKMIVWGGGSTGINTGGLYDPVANTWTATNLTGAPIARKNHTAVWTGAKMIVWGGSQSSTYLNSGALYDPVANSWTPTTMMGAPAALLGNHGAEWTGGKMIVWGRSFGGNTGGLYDPVADKWIAMTPTGAPTNFGFNTTVWTGAKMIVWGGAFSNAGGLYTPCVLPNADSWTATTTVGAPGGRFGHTVVWTGSKMIVWGGYGAPGPGYQNTGGLYDPVTNSWMATMTTGAPSARADHTAVWNGSKMIVWGGEAATATYLNSGGLYDPVANTWLATTTTGAPSVRAGHTSVWTGSKMIVWGGGPSNIGGQYDPVTNTWTPTTITGAPAARTGHTAVWTGSRMIVWGGYNGGTTFNTGGQYDPGANSWTAISTTSAPGARVLHTALWTGSKMIVWGGGVGASYSNTGGLYDPVANTWISATISDAPTARSNHTAVWTGSKMIIWGGFDGSSSYGVKTGGQYDPLTDRWKAQEYDPVTYSYSGISISGAPVGRDKHRAVWTGSKMIVWGGGPISGWAATNTGGIYTPED